MVNPLVVVMLVSVGASPNPNPEWDPAWANAENPILSGHVELTTRDTFVKAGESYFGPDGDWIIFQGVPVPAEGESPDRYYSMYVAGVKRDESGAIVGLHEAFRVSKPGSSNTCGWAHPTKPYHFLFGSTTTVPSEEGQPGYQRGTSSYSWQFPRETEIVASWIDPEFVTAEPEVPVNLFIGEPKPIFERDGYDAEGSWSYDARFILYTHVAPPGDVREGDGDIWVYDTLSDVHTPLVTKPGYDGGPFFSPDAKRICYRSDRRGDKLLQVMVADLDYQNGTIVGIKNETQLTDNEHVNWAPFFTLDGKYLFYATSEMGHANYEVFAVSTDTSIDPDVRPRLRITQARGFDGLPTFSPDGQWMMWTAQRGALVEGEDRPSSQIWAAKYDHEAFEKAYAAARKALQDKKDQAAFESYEP
ncbi:MAG: hypothetical protein R3B49_04105 [Phycisphaerales bacterium]